MWAYVSRCLCFLQVGDFPSRSSCNTIWNTGLRKKEPKCFSLVLLSPQYVSTCKEVEVIWVVWCTHDVNKSFPSLIHVSQQTACTIRYCLAPADRAKFELSLHLFKAKIVLMLPFIHSETRKASQWNTYVEFFITLMLSFSPMKCLLVGCDHANVLHGIIAMHWITVVNDEQLAMVSTLFPFSSFDISGWDMESSVKDGLHEFEIHSEQAWWDVLPPFVWVWSISDDIKLV